MPIFYHSFVSQTTKMSFALAVFFLLSISGAYAQCPQVATATETMTWTGAVSTDWADACNWSPNGVPGPGNYVQISIGATNPILSTTATVRSVQLNNSKLLTVSSTGRLNLIGDGGNVSGINFYESSSLQNDGSIYIEALDGSTLTYTDIFYGSNSNGCSLTNNGFIRVNSTAYVIGLRTGNSITNNSCGRMTLLGGGNFSNPGVVTNYGLIETANSILQSGTFTNNGVLKYGSLTGTITNSGNGSVIVNNTPTPIFTYGGTYNGTINGIFSDADATVSAGTFTAPNTFVPSGLPTGSQTLYAQITPSGGACTYIVPFIYDNCSNSPTLYVDASIATSGNGETWATAYKTLDEALAVAHCCSIIDTIKVATGTYLPTKKPYNGCTEMTTANARDLTFHLPDGLVLWGGYPAGGGARNSTANITTLSGDFNGDDAVTGSGSSLSITGNGENAYHVVLASAPTSGGIGVTIDGFSIIGGNANGSSFVTVNGNNVVRESGGAIITLKGTNALTNNLIYNNAAINGGGIYANGTNTITNNTISGNRAIGNSSSGGGGGIYANGTNNTLAYNTISGNRSGGEGGGGIYAAGMNSITNNTLLGNSVTFVAYSGRGGGGGIYATYGTTTITNNTLSGNSAIHGDGSGGGGGGISIDQGTHTLTNNTLSGNSAIYGGGIFTNGGINTISNNILWGNQQGSSSTVAGADYYAMSAQTNNNIFTNNLLQLAASNYPTDASLNYGIGTAASGNIFAQDPLFVNAADIDGADDIHRTADDGLRLQSSSPCINTGNNTGVTATDITGAARIQNTTVDIGAYEGGVIVCPTVPTLYVDASIATSGNGQSWAAAYKTLDEALAVAHCCSIIDTIKVATGTYLPTKKPYNGCTEMATADPRDLTFHLPDGLVLWGGYPAGGGVRNNLTNITTLSGDFNGDDVVTGSGSTLSFTGNGENAYHVVVASTPIGGTGVTVDGFAITGGNANGTSNLTVSGNAIGSDAGGAIFSTSGDITLTNNTLSANSASGKGGAVFLFSGINLLTNNTILGNTADLGGGIYAFFSTNTLTNNTLSGNSARYGGGIFSQGSNNTLKNNTLSANSASAGGGGIYTYQGTDTVTNCIFWDNLQQGSSTGVGADIYISYANTVTYCLTQAGSTYSTGTGIINNQDPLFVNATDIDGADNIHRTADDGLKLSCASPAYNAGTSTGAPTTDITGTTRPQLGAVDMGAYENVLPTIAITGATTGCGSLSLSATELPGVTYCWQNTVAPQTWQTVGNVGFSVGSASHQSLAFNSSTPYVAYSDGGNSGKATVMKFDGTNWVVVGNAGFSAGTATYQSLVFNGSTPYVAYSDDANSGKSTVMKFDGTNWVLVGNAGFSAGTATYTSLVFNGSTPYVAYRDLGNGGKSTVMKFDGTNWVIVGNAGFSAGQVSHPSLAFNGSTPYVAYADVANGYKTTVMKFDGTNWVVVGNVGFSAGQATGQSLAFNGSTPYVAYADVANGYKTTVMEFDGTNWVTVGNAGFSAGTADYTSLAFNGSTPYVAYQDGANGNKSTVMKFDGTNWVTVGNAGFSAGAAYYQSLAFYGSTPYVAYRDGGNGYKTTVMKFDNNCIGSSSSLTVSSSDTYTVIVTDSNGCSATASTTVEVPTALTVSAVATDALCNGGNGSVVVSASGGTSPYTGEGTFSEVAGTYTYTVTDDNGCSATASATVSEPTQLTASAVATDAACNGDNGSVVVSASGGTSPYTGEGTFSEVAGTYTYTVTDDNGCSATASATVAEPSALTVSAVATDALCNGGNGSVVVSASGGTSPYTGEGTFSEVAGTYTYTVTDDNGCSATASATVSEPTQLTVSAVATDAACNGGSGSVVVSASGGTSPYTGEGTFSEVAGTYTYTVTDDNGCSATASATVGQAGSLVAATLTSGSGCAPVTLTAEPYNGTDYTYAWSAGATGSGTDNTATITTADYYTVTVTEVATGCTATAERYGFVYPAAVLFLTSNSPQTCGGVIITAYDYDPNITAAPTARQAKGKEKDKNEEGTAQNRGGGTYYDFGDGFGTANTYIVNSSGTYTVTIQNGYGCTTSATIEVVVTPGTAEAFAAPATFCAGEDIALTMTTDIPLNASAPYTMNPNAGVSFNDISSTGTAIGIAEGLEDDTDHSITLPFSFNYNGTAYTEITISSNGVIAFGNYTNIDYYNDPLPTDITDGDGAYAAIAAFWDDLDIDTDGPSVIHTQQVGNTFIIQWNISHNNIEDSADGLYENIVFQMVLDATTGAITFVYNDVNFGNTDNAYLDAGGDATIGLSLSPTSALQYSYNTASLTNGQSIQFTPFVPTLSYSWEGPNGFTSTDEAPTVTGATAVNAGVYTVTVSNANGCSATASTTVVQNTLVASAVATDAACNGDNGSVVVSASGGTSPYTGEGTFTETAGTYTYTVTDDNGCSATASATVSEPSALIVSAVATDAGCNGGTGSVVVSASGGTSPYTGEGTFSELAGTYTYTVTDANGCSATASATVSEPSALIVSAVATDAGCNGGTGSVVVSASGGTSPYTGEGTFIEVAGTYTYTVTDDNGCSASASATVSEPSALIVSTVATDAACNGGNGSVVVSASGGTSPYTGEGTFSEVAGTYTYTITDDNGCSATASATVSEPSALIVSAVATDAACNGGTGSVVVSASGGTSPYTGEGTFTEVAGTYTYTVTDANGCSASASATINQSASLGVTTEPVDARCNGANGSVNAIVVGGTSPYTYIWSNDETTEDLSAVVAGTYTVTVSDDNGCSGIASAIVAEPAILSASSIIGDISCNGGSNGGINVTSTGGTSPYTYAWSNSATTEGLSGLTADTYVVTITDDNGCTTVLSATVNEVPPFNVFTAVTDATCANNNGVIDLSVFGATPEYTYEWSNGGGSQDLSGLSAGIYTVTITDFNGCVTTASATVAVPTVPTISSANVVCAISGGAITVTASGIGLTYNIGAGAQTSNVFNNVANGTYTVTVTNAAGCTGTTNVTVNCVTCPTPIASNNGSVCAGSPINLSVNPNLVSGVTATYVWSGPAGTSTQQNPVIANATLAKAGTYTVTVTYSNGCTAIASTTVVVNAKPTVTAVASCVAGVGRITVTASGTGLTYNIGAGAQASNVFNNVANGTYTVIVINVAGCTGTANVTVNCVTCPTPVASNNGPICAGSPINLSVNPNLVSGVTATYVWSGPAGTSTQQNPVIANATPAKAGTYTVTVTYSNGCTATASTTVVVSTLPTANISANGPLTFCGGGSVILAASGGSSYAWSNGTGAASTTITIAGTYTVTVSDGNACSATASQAVIVNPSPNASITGITTACGSVSLTATGGTTYAWSGGATPTSTSNTFNISGAYTVTVTNSNGCSATASQTVTIGTLPNASITGTTTGCGSVSLTAIGGTAYAWSGGATPNAAGNTFTASGTYTVTVTNANGCSATVNTNVVINTAASSLAFIPSQSTTGGFSPFAYNTQTLVIYGGTTPYDFTWDNTGYVRYDITYGNIDHDNDPATAAIPAATVTIYYVNGADWSVTVTDENSCSSSALDFNNTSDSVDANAFLNIDDYSITGQTSSLIANGAIDINVIGGNCLGAYSYEWSGPDGFSSSTQDISDLMSGWYNVSVTCGSETVEGWYWVPSESRGRGKVDGTEPRISITPNPFNEQTTIQFYAEKDGHSKMMVYAIDGREVAVLFDGETAAHTLYSVSFTAGHLPVGTYYIAGIAADGQQTVEKMVLIR